MPLFIQIKLNIIPIEKNAVCIFKMRRQKKIDLNDFNARKKETKKKRNGNAVEI